MAGDGCMAGHLIAGARVENGAGKWRELLQVVLNTSEVNVSLTM
jgi:hypothetical protein